MKNNALVIYTNDVKKITNFTKYTSMVSDFIIANDKKEYLNFVQKDGTIFGEINETTQEIEPNILYELDYYKLLNIKDVDKKSYLLDGVDLIIISNQELSTIVFDSLEDDVKITISYEDDKYYIYQSDNYVIYHNNIPVLDKQAISHGDVIDIGGTELIFNKHNLIVMDYVHNIKKCKLIDLEVLDAQESSEYKRSPRIVYPEPSDDVEIVTPPDKENVNNETLFKIIVPPLLTVSVTVVMSLVLGRGPYVFMALATSVLAIIFSISNYVSSRRDRKTKNANRISSYRKYLKRKLLEINSKVKEQEFAINYHYPSNEDISKFALENSSRMYEKSSLNHDFLQIRIGMANLDYSFKINYDEKDFSEQTDELLDEAKAIKNHFSKTKILPRTIHLEKGAVGLIGPEKILREQIALIINQIAFFHSYHDVEIYHAFKEEELDYWKSFNFLPHINSNMIHARTNIYSQRTRDQILNSLYQIIKQRELSHGEKSDSGASHEFLPKIVFIISDMKQIVDHSIMEYLSRDLSHIGVSLIFVERSMKNLPEYVSTVVEFRNGVEGRVINEENKLINHRIMLDHVDETFDFELIPRILSGFSHVQTLQSSIPEKVGFLQMFDVEYTSELNVLSRWDVANPGKTLAVPLGYRGPDDIVELNLHEKAHGPHGLVAGTTGSGKSEIVQSYILSLAINFHPYDVGFLLIDYKGGGMANLFKDLPHLLGTITNLDGAASMRALISIKAELLRRQQLFSENDVNHIDGYQKLYKEGKVSEPMPHLFMISDEFAELKAEQPEFMKELVSTARIGRSLGIHLILATQKPSGVVDDQIWSNSKFKLCLKVQNEADSSEMLKTKDAASITLPGRAYLQVGNNEIYELFQSAYSGAPYVAGQAVEDVRDNRIYEINQLGQYELKTQDLSKGNINITQNELEAVIDEVEKVFVDQNLPKVASPWLEPLKETIYLEELEDDMLEKENVNLNCLIGLTDEPQKQAQNPLYLDLNQGNIGVFGVPGFGKTTFMQTMIMSLVKANTPEQLNIYVLDFGGGLLPIKNLPQVADLITIDEEEKIQKWGALFNGLMKERKALFKKEGVADIETYEQVTNNKLERIVTFIDNYDAMKEAELGDHFDKLMVQLTREGINLGMHVVLSASRSGVVRYNLLANFKEKTTFFVLEKGDIVDIVGRTDLTIDEIPGRAIIKLEEPTLYQAALPIEGNDSSDINKNLREYAQEMSDKWTGKRPNSIPIVPEELTIEDFTSRNEVKEVIENDNILSVGLSLDTVQPIIFDMAKDANLGIAFDKPENLVNSLATILETSLNSQVYSIDNNQNDYEFLSNYGKYESDEDDIIEMMKEIFGEYRSRIERLTNAKANNEDVDTIFDNDKPIVLVVPVTQQFIENIINETMDEQLAELLENGRRYKIYTIWGTNISKYGQLSSPLGRVIRSLNCTLVMGMLSDLPSYITFNGRTYGEAPLNPYEANYIAYGDGTRIKYTS